MQTDYFAFILAAYLVSAAALAALGCWIALDARAQRRELERLEARGIRRRSQAPAEPVAR